MNLFFKYYNGFKSIFAQKTNGKYSPASPAGHSGIALLHSLKSIFRRKSFSNIFGSSGGSSLSTGAKYKSFAYACINARAENIAKAKVYLYNAETKAEIPKHPFLDLIVKPNKQNQTFKEILHKISSSLDLYGNSYVFIQRGVRKIPIGLYVLPSNIVI